ncbi:major Facilitator Superfamily protein [Escherichia coli]|nr:major Facilitator Superfamily protein [Escherichia coli]
MKIVPREQYMAAMTFVTLPVRSGRCSSGARRPLVEYASWHWDLFDQTFRWGYRAIATLMLMPNYTMQTRRFDPPAFYCWRLHGGITLALDGSKGTGLSPLAMWPGRSWRVALVLILLHAEIQPRPVQSETVPHSYLSLGLAGSFAGRIGTACCPL